MKADDWVFLQSELMASFAAFHKAMSINLKRQTREQTMDRHKLMKETSTQIKGQLVSHVTHQPSETRESCWFG